MPNACIRARLLALLLGLLTFASELVAQEAAPPGQEAPLPATTIEALETLAEKIAAKEKELAALPETEIAPRAALEKELRELRWRLGSISSRADVRQFEAPSNKAFDLRSELEELVRPVIQALKDATAESRQISALKKRAEALVLRRHQAQAALREAIATLERLPDDSPARDAVRWEIDRRWRPAIEALSSELVIVRGQIDAKEQAKKPMLEVVSDGTRSFLERSGLSILLGALVFCAVFFSLRWIQGRLLRNRRAGRATSVRVLEILLATLSILLSVIAALIVPFVRDDWLLLPICIVILLGVGWVLVRMLPQFYEQIRLVLNIGPVREGERLLLDGLPYRVDQLRFYSRLSNPDLDGGELRVPIQELLGRRSRQPADDEPWFPCRRGDYVLLDDGVYGEVLVQTPEVVVVDDYAAPKSYATKAFLAANPRNLSRGFAVTTTFGIDYAHQRDATTAIPERLTAALRAGLERIVEPESIRQVFVEFEHADDSSLELYARADFGGEAAASWRPLARAMQRLLVEACTENGWNIPFPQLTVHGVRSGS